MKLPKSISLLAIAALFTAGYAFADDAKDGAKPAKVAACCAKAQEAGKDCSHACCVEAMKAGNNCEKCGGSGAVAKK